MDGFSVYAAHSSHEWRPVPLVGRTYWTRLLRAIVSVPRSSEVTMDEVYLADRVRRSRREILEAKDVLVASHRLPSGEAQRFRKAILDSLADLERDLAEITRSDLGLDPDTIYMLADLLNKARDREDRNGSS